MISAKLLKDVDTEVCLRGLFDEEKLVKPLF